MNRRGFVKRLCLLVSIGCLLSGCERPAAPTPQPPLRVGTYYWPGTFWIDIARDQGWFEEAGLDVEFVDTNADYLGSLDDVVEGRLDTASFALFDLMVRGAGGADLVGVIASDYSSGADALIGGPGVERIADLEGKRVGFSGGSYQEYILSIVLQREGMSLAEVTHVEIAGEDAVQALGGDKCDAVMTWEPVAAEAMEKVNGNRLFDTSEIAGLSPAIQAFGRQTVVERSGDIQTFVNVWRRAVMFIEKQPDEAFAIVARVNGTTPEEARAFAALDEILSPRDNERAFSYAMGFESLHGAARTIERFLMARDQFTGRIDSRVFLDYRFIEASEQAAP